MRNEPRNCKECNTPLIKLNESEDDKYLLANQAFEEKLNSVDYDVWYCTKCTIHEALAYINTNTKYSLCSNCNTVAKYIQSDVIIEQATQHSDGLSLVTFRCNYCKQINREKIVVPSSGSSSESSYSSSGSSSSSSSGSFGGGRSGGGGAGSNW